MTAALAQPAQFSVGDEIEGNFRSEGAWYPGVIFKVMRSQSRQAIRWLD